MNSQVLRKEEMEVMVQVPTSYITLLYGKLRTAPHVGGCMCAHVLNRSCD
jgi:hypothetical protein